MFHDLVAKAREEGTLDLTVYWVPGHEGVEENEGIDGLAKEAARGRSSEEALLPECLTRAPIPHSKAAALMEQAQRLKTQAGHLLTRSPRYRLLRELGITSPSNKFQSLTRGLTRRQASILIQMRSGHAGLNKHLARINRADSPICPACEQEEESVLHFLVRCPAHDREQWTLRRELGARISGSVPLLLSLKTALPHVLRFIHNTGRLRATFGSFSPHQPAHPPHPPTTHPSNRGAPTT
jgi:hypothetical protein